MSEFERRGIMCSGAEEKVDGLVLIQSITEPETMFALVSVDLAPRLLAALNADSEERSHESLCPQRVGGECTCGAFEHNERVRGATT